MRARSPVRAAEQQPAGAAALNLNHAVGLHPLERGAGITAPVAGSVSVGAPVGWKRQRPPVGGAAPYLLCSLGALGAQVIIVPP